MPEGLTRDEGRRTKDEGEGRGKTEDLKRYRYENNIEHSFVDRYRNDVMGGLFKKRITTFANFCLLC